LKLILVESSSSTLDSEYRTRALQVLRLQKPRTQNRKRRRSMSTTTSSTRSAGAAAASVITAMFKLSCLSLSILVLVESSSTLDLEYGTGVPGRHGGASAVTFKVGRLAPAGSPGPLPVAVFLSPRPGP
jgi:hypothetical protein